MISYSEANLLDTYTFINTVYNRNTHPHMIAQQLKKRNQVMTMKAAVKDL